MTARVVAGRRQGEHIRIGRLLGEQPQRGHRSSLQNAGVAHVSPRPPTAWHLPGVPNRNLDAVGHVLTHQGNWCARVHRCTKGPALMEHLPGTAENLRCHENAELAPKVTCLDQGQKIVLRKRKRREGNVDLMTYSALLNLPTKLLRLRKTASMQMTMIMFRTPCYSANSAYATNLASNPEPAWLRVVS